jgi:hypothetical protein
VERLNYPVADDEMQHRWKGLRAAMAETGIDVLVRQNNNDHLIRQDETMSCAEDMNLAIHPTYVNEGVMSWICDDYIINDDGKPERIHAFGNGEEKMQESLPR